MWSSTKRLCGHQLLLAGWITDNLWNWWAFVRWEIKTWLVYKSMTCCHVCSGTLKNMIIPQVITMCTQTTTLPPALSSNPHNRHTLHSSPCPPHPPEKKFIICNIILFLNRHISCLLLFADTIWVVAFSVFVPPKGRLGMSDVTLLSGISGLSFDSPFLSLLFFSA